MTAILIPALFLAAVAFVLGSVILLISKKFYVEEDPMVKVLSGMLPGVNCGACGFPGCNGLAEALAKTRDPALTCPVGGSDLGGEIGQALGIKMAEVDPMICSVVCQGDNHAAKEAAKYVGIQDCWAATQAVGNTKSCPYACVGLGSCIPHCSYNALRLVDGIIEVIEENCTGCGECVQSCPKNVLVMMPKNDKRVLVACRSVDKGVLTKQYCSHGCIGCKKCEKTCEVGAIKVDSFNATINQSTCTSCGACISVCKTESIVMKGDSFELQGNP